MQLITQVCSINNIVDYIKTSKQYKKLNPFQKEELLVQLFHSTNWQFVRKEDRIVVLQELENIAALKINREPYQFDVLPSDYKWDEELWEMLTDKKARKYLIRKNFIEEGIKQCVSDDNVTQKRIEFLNIELLEGLNHEQYHVTTCFCFLKYKPIIYYKEHFEYIIWLVCMDLSKKRVKKDTFDNDYFIYRMIPDEYYAFKYSQTKIKRIFDILNQYYGTDENYFSYMELIKESENSIISFYQKYFSIYGSITYDEIYLKMLEDYINKYSLEVYRSVDEVKRKLSLKPSIIEKMLKNFD